MTCIQLSEKTEGDTMKYTLMTLFVIAFLVIGCAQSNTGTENLETEEPPVVEQEPDQEEDPSESHEVKIDTTGDEDADVAVKQEEVVTKVTIEPDEEQQEETQEALEAAESTDEFCVPGETYTYSGDDGSVDAEIIGLTTYKEQEFCQAESSSTIESAAGTITSDTVYYFDNTYEEYWIVTTTSSPIMPEPQVNEVHLVNGEVVN